MKAARRGFAARWRILVLLAAAAGFVPGSGISGAAAGQAGSGAGDSRDARHAGARVAGSATLDPGTLELLRGLLPISIDDPLFRRLASEDHVSKLGGISSAHPAAVTGGRLVFVRSVWGDLAGLGGTANQTWPGHVAATRGDVAPLAAIGLEPDDLILPPLAANVVQWVSQTGPGSDGILAAIELPPPPPGLPVIDFLTLFTPQAAMTWPAQASNARNMLQPADPSGNQLSALALEPLPGRIAGFAEGVWNAGTVPGQPGGVLAGTWTDPGENLLGFLQGVWVPSGWGPPGGSLAAVVVDTNGSLVAVLQGQYGMQPPPFPGGPMQGVWFDPALGEPIALFQGNFVPSPGPQGGFFQFAWLDPGL